MGACVFETLQVVKGNSRDAYREAQEEANDYNGHQDGYSGDIQTVDGYTMVTDHPRYDSNAWHEWFDIQINTMYKRECKCVELKGVTAKRLKELHGYKGKKGIKVYYFFGWGAE